VGCWPELALVFFGDLAMKYYRKDGELFGRREQIKCSICGEENRDKIQVELIGIAVGMCGEDYSFCRKCWNNPQLGKDLIALLGFEDGIKLMDDSVEAEASNE
jgi:hypothetical protein